VSITAPPKAKREATVPTPKMEILDDLDDDESGPTYIEDAAP
jgi:hypothetical protein